MKVENQLSPMGEITDEERKAVERSVYTAKIDNIVAAERAKWQAEAAAELDEYTAPGTPPKAVQILDRTGHEVHRLVSPTLPLYARMSVAEREWRKPDADHWSAEWVRGHYKNDEARMMRAIAGMESVFGRAIMTEGAAGAAGAVAAGSAGELMPRPLEQVVLIARDKVAKMRRFASNIVMTSQTHTVPTADAMTAYMTAEQVTATDGSPAIAQVQLSANKGQVTALFTVELLADSAINIVNMLATRGGGALGALEDAQFFKAGNGTPPNITAFLAGTNHAITTGDLRFTDVVEMYFGVAQEYRADAVWFAAPNVLQILTALKGAGGQQFYLGLQDVSPGAIADDPMAEGTLMRKPIYEVQLTAGTLWFGNPAAAYVIGTRAGLSSSMSEHVKFNLDQVMWKMTQRFDGTNLYAAAGQQSVAIDSALTT